MCARASSQFRNKHSFKLLVGLIFCLPGCRYTTARATLDSLLLDRHKYDGDTNRCTFCVAFDALFPSAALALSVARRESELGPK
jgi:hypothetical protein